MRKIFFLSLLIFCFASVAPAQETIPKDIALLPGHWRCIRSAKFPDVAPPEGLRYPLTMKKGTIIPLMVPSTGFFLKFPDKKTGEEREYATCSLVIKENIYDETKHYVLLPRGTVLKSIYRIQKYHDQMKIRFVGIQVSVLGTPYNYSVMTMSPQLIAVPQFRNRFKILDVLENIEKNDNYKPQNEHEAHIYKYYYEKVWLDTVFDDPPMVADLVFPLASFDRAGQLQESEYAFKSVDIAEHLDMFAPAQFTLEHDLLFAAPVDVEGREARGKLSEERYERIRKRREKHRE